MALPIDLAELDRRIAAVAQGRRRAALGLEEEAPVVPRAISNVELLGALEADKGYPLADAAARWVARLVIARVTASEEREALRARERLVPSELSQSTDLTLRALIRRVLAQPDARADARLLGQAAQALGGDALRRWSERRHEAERRLGRPVEGARALAEQTLALTDALRPEPRGDDGVSVLRESLASDAGEGWPARLTPRFVREAVGGDAPYAGLRLEVGELPPPLGAASFARAFQAFGQAFAWGDRAAGSFCLARAPHDTLIERRGALYASIVLEPAFHRGLGLGAARAKEQVRLLARAATLWLRLAAVRVLAWPLVGQGSGARELRDLSERALGRPLPDALFGLLPRLAPDRDAALVGAVEAAFDRDVLRERFDEDWYRNPRAIEALRDEHHKTLLDRPARPEVAVALAALVRRLGEALDG